jgi:hypothetical protein
MTALWVIVLCGALSVYAIWATVKADAGNHACRKSQPRSRRRAGYLKRQYMTIAMVAS